MEPTKDLIEQAAGWVSVKERRSEIALPVLVYALSDRYHYEGWFTGFRANGGWYIYSPTGKTYVANDDADVEVTHWMALPPPPAETPNP